MYTSAVLQQIESALGEAHPNPDAMLHERIDFICRAIERLVENQNTEVDTVPPMLKDMGDGRYTEYLLG